MQASVKLLLATLSCATVAGVLAVGDDYQRIQGRRHDARIVVAPGP